MQHRTCSIEGCARTYYSRSFCRRHYEEDLAKRHKVGGPVGKIPAGTLNCSHCSKEFKAEPPRMLKAAAGRRVYCSRVCQKEANGTERACLICGKVSRRSNSKTFIKSYCSKECRNIGLSAQKPRQGTTEPCANCGEPVYRIESWARQSREVRLCSHKCRSEWLTGRERVERPIVPCEKCGKEMRLSPDDRAHGRRFCSKECVNESKRAEPGYRYVDPNSGYAWIYLEGGRRAQEHRYVMEQHIGRPLLPTETVHHLRGGFAGRSNNKIDNLELWSGRHTPGHRVADIVTYCREMLAVYGNAGERGRYEDYAGQVLDDAGEAEPETEGLQAG